MNCGGKLTAKNLLTKVIMSCYWCGHCEKKVILGYSKSITLATVVGAIVGSLLNVVFPKVNIFILLFLTFLSAYFIVGLYDHFFSSRSDFTVKG